MDIVYNMQICIECYWDVDEVLGTQEKLDDAWTESWRKSKIYPCEERWRGVGGGTMSQDIEDRAMCCVLELTLVQCDMINFSLIIFTKILNYSLFLEISMIW